MNDDNTQSKMIVDVSGEDLFVLVGGALEFPIVALIIHFAASVLVLESFAMADLQLIALLAIVHGEEKVLEAVDDASSALPEWHDDEHSRTSEALILVVKIGILLQFGVVRQDACSSLEDVIDQMKANHESKLFADIVRIRTVRLVHIVVFVDQGEEIQLQRCQWTA